MTIVKQKVGLVNVLIGLGIYDLLDGVMSFYHLHTIDECVELRINFGELWEIENELFCRFIRKCYRFYNFLAIRAT